MPNERDDILELLETCERVSAKDQFKEDYELTYKIGVLADLFSHSNPDDSELRNSIRNSLDGAISIFEARHAIVSNLIKSAFLFSSLDSNIELDDVRVQRIDNLRNKAYRIAISLFFYQEYKLSTPTQHPTSFSNSDLIYLLLTKLGILSEIRTEGLGLTDQFSFDFRDKISFARKENSNRVSISELAEYTTEGKGDDAVFFSDFQTHIFEKELLVWKNIIISAPTSAWKTFVVRQYIAYKILKAKTENKGINLALIVPTKALINELKIEFLKIIKEYWLGDEVNLHTHLSGKEYLEKGYQNQINLFLFTQERLGYFYSDLKFSHDYKIKFDFIAVDEAHKVWMGHRWVLLNYVINEILLDGWLKQLCLLSPLLRNLSKLKQNFDIETAGLKFSNFGLVAKNLLIVKKEWIRNWNFYLKINENLHLLFSYKEWGLTQPNYLAKFAPLFTTENSSTLIYRRYPDDTVDQARVLPRINRPESKELEYLKIYAKETVSENFELIDFLSKGIAYHNWQLPISIKAQIEKIYKESTSIGILCVNSTVLEWVNLPAKNIFIGNDAADHTRFKMTSLELKNLMGRAGRLNHHLSWNVFFFDSNKYAEKIGHEDNNTEEFGWNLEKLFKDDSRFDLFIKYLTGSNYKSPVSHDDRKAFKDFEYTTWFLLDKYTRHWDQWFNSEIKRLIFSSEGDEKIDRLAIKIKTIYSDRYRNVRNNPWLEKLLNKNLFIDPRRQIDLFEEYINPDFNFYENIYQQGKELIQLFQKKCNEREKDRRKKALLFALSNAQFYFIRELKNRFWIGYFENEGLIFAITHQWITEVPLKDIITTYPDLKISEVLRTINEEVQFNYFNALKVYADIVELVYAQRKNEISDRMGLFLSDKFELDVTPMIEAWGYSADIVYLISKWVDRESALFLRRTVFRASWAIRQFGEKPDSFLHRNKEQILRYLHANNHKIIERELTTFIY